MARGLSQESGVTGLSGVRGGAAEQDTVGNSHILRMCA